MNSPCIRAKLVGESIQAADGKQYEFLGPGARYGFDSAYAVRVAGEVTALPLPCHTMPWPFSDEDVAIESPQRVTRTKPKG